MHLRKLHPRGPNLAHTALGAPSYSSRNHPETPESDELIIARVLGGETDAYQTLVERHQRALYACAWQVLRDPIDAEEAVQEALVQAFVKLNRLREPRYFFTWAWKICTTVAIRWRRRTKRQALGLDTSAAPAPHNSADSEVAERDRAVLEAMRKLPNEQRQALTLRYWEELDYAAMSALTGVSEVALYQRVSRGLKTLRKLLGEEFMDGEAMLGGERTGPIKLRGIED